MSKHQRDKGARFEREVVNALRDAGIDAMRTAPLQTYLANDMPDIKAGDITIECKARASGFKQIYDWKGEHDLLVIKADRREVLVVQTLSSWIKTNAKNQNH